MKDEQKKSKRKQHKAQKANELKAKFEQEKDLKNEAYFFIIESGNFDNFKKWIDSRRQDGLTAATAHAETICFLSGTKETIRLTVTDPDKWEKVQAMSKSTKSHQPPTQPTSKPDPKDELIETLQDCNATQRQLIQLQEGKITRLTELLAAAKGVK